MMREAMAVAWKDFRLEMRTKERLSSMVVFSLMVILSFRFAFSFFNVHVEDPAYSSTLVPPILWIAFFFAGMLGLAPAFAKENDAGTMKGLLLAPADRFAIYIGKLVSSLAFIFIVSLSSILFFGLFFNFDYSGEWAGVIGVALLGTLAYTSIGVTVSALSSTAKTRDVLLPLLLITVTLFTVVVPSINATSNILDADYETALTHVRYVIAFTLVSLVLSYLLFDEVLED